MFFKKAFIRKGFTLIELLAVIIILAIILLIAVPKISDVIEQADEEARVLSLKGYAKAAEMAVDRYNLSNNEPVVLSNLEIDTTNDNVSCSCMDYKEEFGIILSDCTVDGFDKKYNYINKNVYDNVETFNSIINDNSYDTTCLATSPEFVDTTDTTPGTFAGTGASSTPYLIESVEDLVALSNNVNGGNNYSGKYFSLELSLDFKNNKSYVNSLSTSYGDINGNGQIESLITELTTGKGFLPIGNNTTKFSGNILGNNYILYNLYINRSDLSYVGFIGYNDGTIRNLDFTNADITGIDYTGIVAGKNNYRIIDVEVDGDVVGNNYVGLVTGYVGYGDQGIAIGVIAKGNVSGVDYVGGLAGLADYYSLLKGIFLEGTVTGTGSYVARTLGRNYYGNVRSYAVKTNLVKGATVTSTDIGGNNGVDINSLSDVTTNINAADAVLDTYIGGDNDSDGYYWDYDENGVLVEKNTSSNSLIFNLTGAGTTASPYQINNYEDLKMATQKLNMVYSINSDIDLSGKKFYMFGSVANSFTGTIMGNQHTISNININASKVPFLGFSGLNNGTIRNLNFVDANITGSDYVGIVTGKNDNKIIDVEVAGNVVGNNFVGLVTGQVGYDHSAVGVIAKGNVSGVSYVGGLAGHTDYYSVLKGIFLEGTVTGTGSYVGRTLGKNNSTIISYSMKTNLVNGATVNSTDIGGVNGANINSLSDVTTNINAADAVLDTYIGGDNDSDGYYWDYDENGVLVEKNTSSNSLIFNLTGAGTTASPYQINNYEDLKMATQKLNMVYSINSDIDLSGKKFYMFGSVANSFTGTIMGNQHTISNIEINTPKASYMGFSGRNSGIIRNLNFTNANITGNEFIGIAAGKNDNKIIDVEVAGNVVGNNYVGLVTGQVGYDHSVVGVIAKGNVSGVSYVGGLAGHTDYFAVLKGMFLEGTVTGTGSYVSRTLGKNSSTIRSYAIKTNLLNGVTVTSTVIDSNNGADINNLSDIMTDINLADVVLDTSIGGDNDADGYYWAYDGNGVLVEKPAV